MDPMIEWQHIIMFCESCKSHNWERILKMLKEQQHVRECQARAIGKAITTLTAKYGGEDSSD